MRLFKYLELGRIKKYIKNKPDGLVPAYSGLHPHSIYGNDYAFLKVEGKRIIDIKEKDNLLITKLMNLHLQDLTILKADSVQKYIEKILEKKC